MTATFQPGTHSGRAHPDPAHPDIESLSAFAEQALSEHERSRLLAHLAVCPRCRQIVALAHQPVEEEIQLVAAAPPISSPPQPNPQHHSRPWWRNPWLVTAAPLAALAASATFVLYVHQARIERDVQLARNSAPAVTSQVESPTATPQPETGRPAPPPSLLPPSPPRVAADSKTFRTESRREFQSANPSASPEPAAAPTVMPPPAPVPPAATQTVTVASAPSTVETVQPSQDSELSRLDSSQPSPLSKSEPLRTATSRQQMQSAQQQAVQNSAHQNSAHIDGLQSVAGIATAQSEPLAAKAASSNASSAASAAPTVSNSSFAAATAAMPRFGTFAGASGSAQSAVVDRHIHLPSNRPAASVASAGPLMLSLDSAGALFLSRDSGSTWQPITAQWTGRAVLVRVVLISSFPAPAAAAEAKSVPGAASAHPPTFFEVLNDQNQIWRSTDGVTWLAK
jgi:hypothetical protein